eukprot:gene54712-73107_t
MTDALRAVTEVPFPASYSDRVRQIGVVNTKNKWLTRLIATMLDGPAALRRYMIENYVVEGFTFDQVLNDDDALEAFVRKVVTLKIPKILRTEIGLFPVERVDRLDGCGLLVVNPPWKLDEEWSRVGPCLAELLAIEGKGWCRTEWVSPE